MKLPDQITKEPYAFDFYQAIRQLECYFKEKPRVGESLTPGDDYVRLGQEPSTLFAPSTLASAQQQGNQRLRLLVYFYGLFGPNGALPLHLTEYAKDRVRNAKDESMIYFMDIFHHRMLSLFYRIWANKEPAVQYDRPEVDRFHIYVGALLGIGMPGLHDRDDMPDNSKLHYAGHLGAHTKHAEGLALVLQSFFRVPVNIEEFVAEWLTIPQANWCCLGASLDGGKLGEDAVIGERSWQRQSKFRVVIGPMNLQEYENLLPGQNKLRLIATVIKNYLGYELNWDVRLILKKDEIPKTVLGQYGQLGWTSWLYNKEPEKDSDEFLAA